MTNESSDASPRRMKEAELRAALTDFVALAESAPADFDRMQVWIDRDLFVNAMRALDLAFCPQCNSTAVGGDDCRVCGGSGMLPILTADILGPVSEERAQ